MPTITSPMRGYSKTSHLDPLLRLSAAIVTQAFYDYRRFAKTAKTTKDKQLKKSCRASMKIIQNDLCSEHNYYVNFLESHGHALDTEKIIKQLKKFRKEA